MGKRIAFFLFLILMVGGALLQNFYVTDTGTRLISHLEQIRAAVDTEDYTSAISEADAFCANWEKEKPLFEAIFEHNEVDVISATAKTMQSYCHSKDRDHSLAEIAAAIYYFNHIIKIDGIHWENIF